MHMQDRIDGVAEAILESGMEDNFTLEVIKKLIDHVSDEESLELSELLENKRNGVIFCGEIDLEKLTNALKESYPTQEGICPTCGSTQLIQTGTCHVCSVCGESVGACG